MNTYTLQRDLEDEYGTHGRFLNSAAAVVLYTIEQPWRNNHPWDGDPKTVSCIMPGSYICTPHDTPEHPKCWLINSVPGRSACLIHTGNRQEDTEGCVIVGRLAVTEGVLDSKLGLQKLRDIEGWPSTFRLDVRAIPNDNNMTT